ncbi:hypothetical protein BCR39DRAFT_560443 [Naematelia encephala]|uniref:Uncharacterized protein n=1 Tax=Naematelia encephala TaxID=71784 RepID=A0A1Y2AVZ9_9TREE|nr:hypothetical protein BCR39DRAFT_560443 [Naematelia encephala]
MIATTESHRSQRIKPPSRAPPPPPPPPPAPMPIQVPLPPPESPTTNISYSAWSPSPSEIEMYKTKRDRIRHWTEVVPNKAGARPTELSEGAGVGVGAAVWTGTGTSVSNPAISDKEYLTTVREKEENIAGLEEKSMGPGPMLTASNTGSVRTVTKHGPAGSRKGADYPTSQPLRAPTTIRSTTQISAMPNTPNVILTSSRSITQPQRPPLRYTKTPPIPLLAQAPPTMSSIKPLPDVCPSAPGSTRSEREAYINSALSLPLEMLNERSAPIPVSSDSASQLTTSRLGSLLGRPKSGEVMGKGASDEQHLQNNSTAHGKLKRSVTHGVRATRETSADHAPSKSGLRLEIDPAPPTHTQTLPKTWPRLLHDSEATIRAAIHHPLPSTTQAPSETTVIQATRHPLPPSTYLNPISQISVPTRHTSLQKASLPPVSHLEVPQQYLTVPSLGSRTSQRSKSAEHQDTRAGESVRALGSQNSQRSVRHGSHVHSTGVKQTDGISRLDPPFLSGTNLFLASEDKGQISPRPAIDSQALPRTTRPDPASTIRSVPTVVVAAQRALPPTIPAPSQLELSHSSTAPAIGSQSSQHSRLHLQPEVVDPVRALGSHTSQRPTRSVQPQQDAVMASVQIPEITNSHHSHRSSMTVGAMQRAIPSDLPYLDEAPADLYPAPRNQPSQASAVSGEIPPPHRQQLPLPRPAITTSHSPMDRLGRKHRDASTTTLTARFEPEMYPLPPSMTTSTLPSPALPSGQQQPRYNESTNRSEIIDPEIDLNQDITLDSTRTHLRLTPPHIVSEVPLAPTTPSEKQAVPSPVLLDEGLPEPQQLSPVAFQQNVQFSPASPSVQGLREDEDHVSFEVPSGTRGRLRVSLAWLRDGSGPRTRARTQHQSPSQDDDRPPPVPPKSPPSLSRRIRDSFGPSTGRIQPVQQANSPLPVEPEISRAPVRSLGSNVSGDSARHHQPKQPSPSRPPQNPINAYLDRKKSPLEPFGPGRSLVTPWFASPNQDPYYTNAALPAYQAQPTVGIYQMQNPFIYPQPGMPGWPGPNAPAQPALARTQAHIPSTGSPPRSPSIEPPSPDDSPPRPPHLDLPPPPAPIPPRAFIGQTPRYGGYPYPTRNRDEPRYPSDSRPFWKRMTSTERRGRQVDEDPSISNWRRGIVTSRTSLTRPLDVNGPNRSRFRRDSPRNMGRQDERPTSILDRLLPRRRGDQHPSRRLREAIIQQTSSPIRTNRSEIDRLLQMRERDKEDRRRRKVERRNARQIRRDMGGMYDQNLPKAPKQGMTRQDVRREGNDRGRGSETVGEWVRTGRWKDRLPAKRERDGTLTNVGVKQSRLEGGGGGPSSGRKDGRGEKPTGNGSNWLGLFLFGRGDRARKSVR